MSARGKIWIVFLAILVVTFFAGLVDLPQKWGVPYMDVMRKFDVKLGLDLQGGSHLVYQVDVSEVSDDDVVDSIAGARDVIERRVNAFGVSEPVIQTNKSGSEWRIIVELAGVFDVNEAIQMIGETPLLEFKEEGEPKEIEKPEGVEFTETLTDAEGNPVDLSVLQQPEFNTTGLTGTQFERAEVQFDPNTSQPIITLQFNDEGSKMFAEITKRNVGKRVAIFLDGEPISAPVVQEEIPTGQAQITGDFTVEEARELKQRLNAGALPVPVELISQQRVGATLGQYSIQQSLVAGIIGLILLGIFMIIYYRLPGFLSVAALAIYTIVVLAIFKLLGITLTLAGIAGFILSIGMAVDANVLIFERTKEALRDGQDLVGAVEEGFKHAWKSIRDSNISSLITTLILYALGTSIVRGFAVTLGIGILISMFSAIIVTRNFLRLVVRAKHQPSLWWFGVKVKNQE